MKNLFLSFTFFLFAYVQTHAGFFLDADTFWEKGVPGQNINLGIGLDKINDSSKVQGDISKIVRSEYVKTGLFTHKYVINKYECNFTLAKINLIANEADYPFQTFDLSLFDIKHSAQAISMTDGLKLTLGFAAQQSFKKNDIRFFGVYAGFCISSWTVNDIIPGFKEDKFNGAGPVCGLTYFYKKNDFTFKANNEFKGIIWDKSLYIINPEISLEYKLIEIDKGSNDSQARNINLKAVYTGYQIFRYNSNAKNYTDIFSIGILYNI